MHALHPAHVIDMLCVYAMFPRDGPCSWDSGIHDNLGTYSLKYIAWLEQSIEQVFISITYM